MELKKKNHTNEILFLVMTLLTKQTISLMSKIINKHGNARFNINMKENALGYL